MFGNTERVDIVPGDANADAETITNATATGSKREYYIHPCPGSASDCRARSTVTESRSHKTAGQQTRGG